jgi:hypothetical protein
LNWVSARNQSWICVVLGALVAAFRENKHEGMTYKFKKNKIHINTNPIHNSKSKSKSSDKNDVKRETH